MWKDRGSAEWCREEREKRQKRRGEKERGVGMEERRNSVDKAEVRGRVEGKRRIEKKDRGRDERSSRSA